MKALLLFLLVVPLFVSAQSLDKARRLFEDGNHREAADLLQPLIRSSKTDAQTTAEALDLLLPCLTKELDELAEMETALETAVQHHPADYRVLLAAARALGKLLSMGDFVDGVFVRKRGGDIEPEARDRIRCLQLLTAAIRHGKNAEPKERVEMLWALYEELTFDGSLDVSDFIKLTDIDKLPEHTEEEPSHYGDGGYYPCDAAGNPVFFAIPPTWEAAKNDGERIRWLLEEISRLSPENARATSVVWAHLIHLRLRAGLANAEPEQLRSLAEDEMWTRTAAGEKRLRLPPDHAFLMLFRAFLLNPPDEKQLVLPSGIDLTNLRNQAEADSFFELLDRHQREELAALLRSQLTLARDKEHRANLAASLEDITGAWGRFLGHPPQPAGKKAVLPFRFRNATQAAFTARKIDVAGILDEAEQRFSKLREMEMLEEGKEPKDPLLSMRSIGTRLRLKGADKFLSKPVAEWKADLQPAEHHEESTTTITTPLSEAGAYYIDAKTAGGHTARCVLWIESITLVATPVKEGMHYFLADAISGAPVADAELQLFGFDVDWENKKQLVRRLKLTTDADGCAIASGEKINHYAWLVRAQLADGRETHLGFEDLSWSEGDSVLDSSHIFILTDRPVYRPGQKVSWHAWAKRVGYDPKLDTNAYAQRDCRVIITGPRDDKLIEQEVTTDASGAVSGSITLAKEASLGEYDIEIRFEGRRKLSEKLSFRVEEYKKPEFAVEVEGPAEPVMLGEDIEFTVKAEYYFGGAVKGAKVRYNIRRAEQRVQWKPPGPWDWLYSESRRGGSYGAIYDYDRGEYVDGDYAGVVDLSQGEGQMDEAGRLIVRIPTHAADKNMRFTLNAEVTDASRRVIAGSGSALAVKEPFGAFVTLDRGWYATGDSGTITVDARTAQGAAVKASGRLSVFLGEKLVKEFAVDLPSTGEFRLLWPQKGSYRLELALKDAKGREVKTTRKTFVHGEGAETAPATFAGLEIEVEKKEYQPGEEVKMLIHTEKPGRTVVLFLRGQNQQAGTPVVLRLEQQTTEYRFPVTAADQPNLNWAAFLLRDVRKHEISGEILIPPVQRIVKVELTTDAPTYEPRGNCRARLVARDAAGKPVKGRIVLTAYDKSLEYISEGSNVENIAKHFWGWRHRSIFRFQDTLRSVDANLSLHDGKDDDMADLRDGEEEYRYEYHGLNFDNLRGYALSARSPPAPVAAAPGGSPAEAETALMIRRKFADSAFWQSIETDEKGEAEVEFPFPDNLTTWKLKAWAMGPQAEVGEAEVEVVTRKDLLVRLQAPRFFVEHDEVLLSAIVHNDHASAQTVETTLELENGTLEAVEPLSASKGEIAAHGEKRLEWRVKAKTAGEALIRMSARSKAGSDAMEMAFPVRVHGAERVETKSLSLTSAETSRKWSFTIPEARRVASTRYELRCATSLVPTILDALPPLIEFPHGCAEQTLNRFVPAVVAVDLMKKLGLKHPEYTESKARALSRAGLTKLRDMMCEDDAGWGWFPGAREPNAHMTALVVRGLQLARYAGEKNADDLITSGIEWLKEHEEHELERLALPKKDKRHKPAPDDTDMLVHAALITDDEADTAMRTRLYEQRDGLSRQMVALLGLACHHAKEAERRDMCLRNLKQHLQQDEATQTAWLKLPAARWWGWENDPIETQAAFLRLLLAADAKDALAPRVVKHLLQTKRHTTHWNSTRDTAAVIQALAYYAQVTRETAAETELEFLLDGKTHSRARLDAKSIAGGHVLVLEADALPTGAHTLEIRKTGAASLYATGALTLFSQEETLPAAGLEIQTQRRFFRVEDRKRTEIASDTPLRSGDLVEVELTLESKHDAEYLLVEDFKPAGFESVSVRSGWNWHGLPCYQEFRDEKVCLYVEHLPQGRHTLRYLVRAETPGRFTALPAQVSAMYAPDLRANSTDWRARVAE